MTHLRTLGAKGLSLSATHETISALIVSGQPFFLARPGGTESEGMRFYAEKRLPSLKKTPQAYSAWFRKFVQIGPGVTHFSDSDLDVFCKHYLQATLDADIFAFGRFAPGAIGIAKSLAGNGVPVTHFLNPEPLFAVRENLKPWTHALEGKNVLIVHPFEKSIRHQFEKRSSITDISKILPDFTLHTLSPPITFAGEKSSSPWVEQFEALVTRALQIKFDVAIIGAGGYGLPLAHAIKKAGRQAIHLGGTTQLLFGIRGKRWDNDRHYAGFFDDTWIRPGSDERPNESHLVEGGSYW